MDARPSENSYNMLNRPQHSAHASQNLVFTSEHLYKLYLNFISPQYALTSPWRTFSIFSIRFCDQLDLCSRLM
eukprot:IDg23115t1